ncbi:MAG TPA: 2,3-bisphosphoglycerate-independent phosphoglycerate mutase [Candidatus Bathyarchaeia archaeon]|nr:2,3-bisphosphoglycerate-independent phosphoglycerate mutase [Candidatus Bathyarchaeia archaeon]
MKAILIVGDGMADRPVRILKSKTPLQAAKKKNIDALAKIGISGIMDVISPGVPPGSDTAHLALFGYDPYKVYRGRGAFEALGVGVPLEKGDVAFRCNLATVDSSGRVVDRRAGRIGSAETKELAETLRRARIRGYPDVRVIVEPATEHRIAVVLKGDGLSSQVSDADPHMVGVQINKVVPRVNTPEAAKTADIVNVLTELYIERLKGHPINKEKMKKGGLQANALLFRGAGELPEIEPLTHSYRLNAAVISGTALIKGVCRSVGIEVVEVDGATGTVDTDVTAKARAAVKALRSHDLVYVHVKGTDNASHDGVLDQKIHMIERIDEMVGGIVSSVDLDNAIMAITADHTTPIEIREHTGDPVPFTMAGHGVRTDRVRCFDEVSCAEGGMNRINGVNLFPIMMSFLGRTKKFGA